VELERTLRIAKWAEQTLAALKTNLPMQKHYLAK